METHSALPLHKHTQAGEVTVNATVAGEAGVSPPVSITITLEHPVLPQHLDLLLNNLPVYPPGLCSLSFLQIRSRT